MNASASETLCAYGHSECVKNSHSAASYDSYSTANGGAFGVLDFLFFFVARGGDGARRATRELVLAREAARRAASAGGDGAGARGPRIAK